MVDAPRGSVFDAWRRIEASSAWKRCSTSTMETSKNLISFVRKIKRVNLNLVEKVTSDRRKRKFRARQATPHTNRDLVEALMPNGSSKSKSLTSIAIVNGRFRAAPPDMRERPRSTMVSAGVYTTSRLPCTLSQKDMAESFDFTVPAEFPLIAELNPYSKLYIANSAMMFAASTGSSGSATVG